MCAVFFFQAEDGIRDAQESRGLGDVYKRQVHGVGDLVEDLRRQDLLDRQALAAQRLHELVVAPVSYTHLTLPTIYSV